LGWSPDGQRRQRDNPGGKPRENQYGRDRGKWVTERHTNLRVIWKRDGLKPKEKKGRRQGENGKGGVPLKIRDKKTGGEG